MRKRTLAPVEFGLILDNALADSSLYLLDEQGSIIYGQPGTDEFLGYTLDELAGRHFRCLIDQEDSPGEAPDPLERCRKEGIVRFALRLLHKHGHRFSGRATFYLLQSGGIAPFGAELALMDSVAQAILAVGEAGDILWANETAVSMFGYSREEIIGLPVENLVPAALRHQHRQHRDTFMAEPRQRPMGMGLDLSAARKDGTVFPIEVSLSFLRRNGVKVAFALVADISARKRNEARIKESEEMHRKLFWESPQPLFLYDPRSHRFLMANHAATALLGYTKQELDQMTIDDIRLHAETPAEGDPHAKLPSYQANGIWKLRRRDGAMRSVEFYSSEIEFGGARARLVHWNDVTELLELEENVVQARDQYQSLAARVMQMQEDERRHLSREIHDSLGQELSALRYQLHSTSRLPGSDEQGWKNMVKTCDSLLTRLREIASHLRPPVLEHLNVAESVEWLVDQFSKRTAIQFVKLIPPACPPAADDVKLTVFRICQESITNIIRHSKASNAIVTVSIDDGFALRIEDDGIGFDQALTQKRSLGLLGMRERCEAVGGTLRIESAPGDGTTVVLTLPGGLFAAGNG